MKIAVVGMGYVGLSMSVLLARKNDVIAFDINEEKVEKVNKGISPIEDKEIEEYLGKKRLNLLATTDEKKALTNADFVVIATPTNYVTEDNRFDTESIENTLELIEKINPETTVVIKSTIPIGYVDSIREKYKIRQIFFAPEFLREGKALYDNLHPSRIVVGAKNDKAITFANLLAEAAEDNDIPIIFTESKEAEAVKLFANTYLALRVSYFNELDTFAEKNGLNSKAIIDSICHDFRIGTNYNNPSFGYGGYCLPKDTKQLLRNFDGIPQDTISAVVKANETRKKHIADSIMEGLERGHDGSYSGTVGIYRLIMKADSDNFRESAVQDIIRILRDNNVNVIIYEPRCEAKEYLGCKVVPALDEFKAESDIIVTNRMEEELIDSMNKIYTRDIYGLN